MLRRDADAVVRHRQADLPGQILRPQDHPPAGTAVFDGVVREVVYDAEKVLVDAAERRALPLDGERHIRRLRLRLQAFHGVFRDLMQVRVFPLHADAAAVELRQVDDVLHELRHALGLRPYLPGKGAYVLLPDHAALDELRVAGDDVQGRFELVGHVRRELLPDEGGLFYLRLVPADLLLLLLQAL